jgi:ABC-type Fe3+ transport system permease subunit
VDHRAVAEDAVAGVRQSAAVSLVADLGELCRDVFGRADFGRPSSTACWCRAGAVSLSLFVGVPAAYALARFPFGPQRSVLRLLAMRMLPPIAVLVPMYVLFSKIGLTTTRTSVMLAYSTFSLPLVVWIMRGFFEDLPRELEESCLGRWRQPLPGILLCRAAADHAQGWWRRASCACNWRGTIFCFPPC